MGIYVTSINGDKLFRKRGDEMSIYMVYIDGDKAFYKKFMKRIEHFDYVQVNEHTYFLQSDKTAEQVKLQFYSPNSAADLIVVSINSASWTHLNDDVKRWLSAHLSPDQWLALS